MPKQKGYHDHHLALNDDDERDFKKTKMKLIDIFRYAMKGILAQPDKTAGNVGVYLSNATSKSKGETIPDHKPDADADQDQDQDQDHPAALQKLEPDQDQDPAVTVADLPEIRPDLVPAFLDDSTDKPKTIVIVRKRTARTIEDLYEPVRPAPVPAPVPLSILRNSLLRDTGFVQLPDRDHHE